MKDRSVGKDDRKVLANGVHSHDGGPHGTTGIDLLRASARDCRPFNLTTRIEWRRRLSCSRWACVALPPIKCSAEARRKQTTVRDRHLASAPAGTARRIGYVLSFDLRGERHRARASAFWPRPRRSFAVLGHMAASARAINWGDGGGLGRPLPVEETGQPLPVKKMSFDPGSIKYAGRG
jgi:hypothetical protein